MVLVLVAVLNAALAMLSKEQGFMIVPILTVFDVCLLLFGAASPPRRSGGAAANNDSDDDDAAAAAPPSPQQRKATKKGGGGGGGDAAATNASRPWLSYPRTTPQLCATRQTLLLLGGIALLVWRFKVCV